MHGSGRKVGKKLSAFQLTKKELAWRPCYSKGRERKRPKKSCTTLSESATDVGVHLSGKIEGENTIYCIEGCEPRRSIAQQHGGVSRRRLQFFFFKEHWGQAKLSFGESGTSSTCGAGGVSATNNRTGMRGHRRFVKKRVGNILGLMPA